MLYLEKNQINTLVLNINNNERETFVQYDLIFTHIMSKETSDLKNDSRNNELISKDFL